MRRRILLYLSILTLGVSACAGPTDPEVSGDPDFQRLARSGISFRSIETEYSHGDTAVFVLRNGTARPVGYNLCGSAREIWTGGAWRRYESFRICTAAIYSLAPGEEAILREPITSEWKAGRYRMVTRVWRLDTDGSEEVFTAPFIVTD